MDINYIKYLITNLLTHSASASERFEVLKWLNSKDAEKDSKKAWKNSSEEMDDALKDRIWEGIQLQIENTIPETIPTKHTTVRRIYSFSKVAATVAIVLCSAFTSYILYKNFIENKGGVEENIYTFKVEPGQKGSICLADGTIVHLNSASKISFAGDYNSKNRIVNLTGEAYFEVAKNPNKKFIVTCNGVDIEALGTEFDVKAYPTDSIITTTLARGKVKVSSNSQSVTLLPNDVATYNLKRRTIKSSTIDDISVANYWRTGQLVFKAEAFSSIARTIERMYNIKIRIQDETLQNIEFTGTIQNNSLDNVLYMMSLSYPLVYTVTDSVVTVSGQNNRIRSHKIKI